MALFRPSSSLPSDSLRTSLYVPPITPLTTGPLVSSSSVTTLTPLTSNTLMSSPTEISQVPNPTFFSSPALAPEVIEEALTLEGSALLALCVAGSPLCGNEDFWRRKFALDFPGVNFSVPGRTWRQRYEILYQQTRLFPIRRVEREALRSLNASIFSRIPSITVETNPGSGEQAVIVPFRKWYSLLNEGVFRGQLDPEPVTMWLNGIPVLLTPTLLITQREGVGFLEDLHRQQVYPSYPAAALDNAGLPEIDLNGTSVLYSENLFNRIFGAFSDRERRAWDQYSYEVAYVLRYVDLYDRLPPQLLEGTLGIQAPALYESLQSQIKLDPRYNTVTELIQERQATGLDGSSLRQLVSEYSQLPGGLAQHARFLADAILIDFRLSSKVIIPYPNGCIPTSLGYPQTSLQCIPIGNYQNPDWLLEEVTTFSTIPQPTFTVSRPVSQTTFQTSPQPSFTVTRSVTQPPQPTFIQSIQPLSTSSSQTTFLTQPQPSFTVTRSTQVPQTTFIQSQPARPQSILVTPSPFVTSVGSPQPQVTTVNAPVFRTYSPVVTGIEQEIPLPVADI